MSVICASTCGGTTSPPTSYQGCTDVTRRFGANHFILLDCSYEFTDILDDAEWTTAIAANNIHLSPAGVLTFNPVNANPVRIEGCGREIPGISEYTVDFSTYQMSATLTDFVYWKNVFDKAASYRIMFVDCNGIFYVDDGWYTEIAGGAPATLAGKSPGFVFSVTQVPMIVEGDSEMGRWQTQFRIRKTGMMEMALLPGVEAVLA